MTGFATAEIAIDSCRLVWEIRSVNHRFLDTGFRVPEVLRMLEPQLRKQIGGDIRRGKVDCTLRIVANDVVPQDPAVDKAALAMLARLQSRLAVEFPGARELSVSEILRWPGSFVSRNTVRRNW
jgi:uncharacterized protein (TIGR00255 family)